MEQDANYYFRRALEKMRTRSKGVLADLDRAIELDSENPKYYLERGSLRFRLDEYQLAFEDFSKVIAFSHNLKELATAHRMKTSCCICDLSLRNSDEFLQDLDWLIEHGFGDAEAFRDRGAHMERLWQFVDAAKDYTDAYQISLEERDLHGRARNYYYLKLYDQALQDFTRIIASNKNPSSVDLARVYDWRGSTYYMLGQQEEAFNDFKEALNSGEVRQLYQELPNFLKNMMLQGLPFGLPKKLQKTATRISLPRKIRKRGNSKRRR